VWKAQDYKILKMKRLRYSHFWIDFQGDGQFPKERIKGKDKRLLRKWTIRKLYKEYLKSERDMST
jgi:hypothetical protein